jgi:hypothetical protein
MALKASGALGMWVKWIAGVCAALVVTSAAAAQAQVRVDPGTMVVSSERTDRTTWNHVVPAGADRYLIVALTVGAGAMPVPAVTSLTCGGVALQQLGAISHPSGVRVELWGVLDPPEGTQAIELRLAAEAALVAGSVAFLGVDPTAPTGPVATGEGDGPVASVTVVSVQGSEILDVYGSLTATPTAGQGQMSNWNQRNLLTGASSRRQGSSSVVMSWSHGAVTQPWAQAAVSIRARTSPTWPEPGSAPESPPDPPAADAGAVAPDAGAVDADITPLPDAAADAADAAGIPDAGSDVGPKDGSGIDPTDGAAGLRRTRLDLGCACELGGPERSAGGMPWVLLPALVAVLARRRPRRP